MKPQDYMVLEDDIMQAAFNLQERHQVGVGDLTACVLTIIGTRLLVEIMRHTQETK